MTDWQPDDLKAIASTDDFHVAPFRDDGVTPGTPTWIWSVVVDGTLLAWIAAQPWSNGNVGTFGKSYLGVTQWQVAPTQPPALRAMAPSMTPSDTYEGNAYQGGATVGHVLGWAVAVSAEAVRRRVADGGTVPAEWARDLDYDAAVVHLPLSDHPALDELVPSWPQWMSNPSDGPYWRSISPTTAYGKVTVPVLNIGGWYDILLGSAC